MLPSATPLAQCFIELLGEMAANRGFLRIDLETILLSFFFGGLGSSPLCQVNTWHDTLRIPSPQSRVQAFRSFDYSY